VEKLRVFLRFGFSLARLSPLSVAGYVIANFFNQTAIPLALAVVVGQLTNAFQAAQKAQTAQHNGILSSYLFWLGLIAVSIPLAIVFRLAQNRMDCRMEKHVREQLFEKVIDRELEFFHRYNPGELSNILMQSSIEAQQAVRGLTIDPLLQVISVYLAVLLIIHQLQQIPALQIWGHTHVVGLIVVVMVVVGAVSAMLAQIRGRGPVDRVQRELQAKRFSLAGLTDSAVKCPEEIQAMGAEPFFSKKYAATIDGLMSLKTRQALTMELINSAIGAPTQILLAMFYGLIVLVAIRGIHSIPLGVFITLAGLTPQLMQPFRSFAALGIIASASWPAVELVSRLLDHDSTWKQCGPGLNDVAIQEPTLQAKHIKFRYPNQHQIFEDLTFDVPPEKITALVAKMGQGKTTFFRLVLRFYDPTAGEIELGGVPTTSFTIRSIRRQVTIMSQFPAFFHGTVRDNLCIANPESSDADIRRVCDQTGLWPILEAALGTDPLDRPFAAGMCLSGGQQRLFALTRCLLRNPRVLFLDEPTTNMDNTEKETLIPLMKKACVGRTVVVVDHDISWLTRFCDHFVVLDQGRVVQEGAARTLAMQTGLFRELLDPAIAEDNTVLATSE